MLSYEDMALQASKDLSQSLLYSDGLPPSLSGWRSLDQCVISKAYKLEFHTLPPPHFMLLNVSTCNGNGCPAALVSRGPLPTGKCFQRGSLAYSRSEDFQLVSRGIKVCLDNDISILDSLVLGNFLAPEIQDAYLVHIASFLHH